MAGTHESNSLTNSVEWYTPAWIFEALNTTFDLDPCQPIGGLNWIPANHHYTIKENGLIKQWNGRIWLNPPYGKTLPMWLKRMSEHNNGIALLFARTNPAWFHTYVATATAVLFMSGRIGFVDKYQTPKNNTSNGSMLVAWNADNAKILENANLKNELGCLVYLDRK